MAELNNTNESTEVVEESTESTKEKLTFTQEELDDLLQRNGDKRVAQALKTAEKKNAERVKEADRLARMSATEKYEYELSQREAAIAAKEKELALAENRNVASRILSDKGLSLDLVNFVVAEDAESMDANIKALEKAFKASVKNEVEKRLASNNPKRIMDNVDVMTKEQFNKLTLAQQTELAHTNRELYDSLTK